MMMNIKKMIDKGIKWSLLRETIHYQCQTYETAYEIRNESQADLIG